MLERKPFIDTAQEWQSYGPHEERPLLPAHVDPQIHASRIGRDQPFHLICEKDTMLVQLAGNAAVEFKASSVNEFPLKPGDFVYVPARTPHRILSHGDGVYLRYKARDAGLEGVAWYCDGCGSEVFREIWDTAIELPQEAYVRLVEKFNSDERYRTCEQCKAVHPQLDIAGMRWTEVAEEMRSIQSRDHSRT